MNKQKKLVILLTLVLCIFIMPLQAFAATGRNHIVAPQWDNTSTVNMSLRCANYNAHCDVRRRPATCHEGYVSVGSGCGCYTEGYNGEYLAR